MFYPYFICIIQIYTILMANTLLQWNCRGLKANFNEVGLLSERYNPQAICLQETLLQDTDNIDFRGFTLLNTFSGIGPHGGSSILIRQGVLHSPVNLTTNLQAVAVRLTLHVAVTLCSLYIPPSHNIQQRELDSLVNQLPTPFIIMGDLNGHNPLWGSNDTNNKGKHIEDMLSDHQLCVFNDGSNTCILQVEHILPLIYLLQIQNLFKILNGMYMMIYVVVTTFPLCWKVSSPVL